MKILVAYDGSICADAAVADLRSAGLPKENEVLVVTVAHGGWHPSKHSGLDLGEFGNPWNAVMNTPWKELVGEAERWHANTIFVGARGSGPMERLLLGNVSTAVLTHAHCSVEIVR